MATAEQIALLRARLNSGDQQGAPSDLELGLLYDQAADLLGKYTAQPEGRPAVVIPTPTLTRCTLDVADRLHALELAPNGQVQFSTLDSPMPTISRDPLIAVYPILDHYLPPGLS